MVGVLTGALAAAGAGAGSGPPPNRFAKSPGASATGSAAEAPIPKKSGTPDSTGDRGEAAATGADAAGLDAAAASLSGPLSDVASGITAPCRNSQSERASATSLAVGYRSSGFLAIIFRMIARRESGTSARNSVIDFDP